MIYAYDKPSAIPLVDVYDRLMMLAEIGAAKDMYEKGLELMKEFKKDYGDIVFSDPSSQDWYANNFNIGGFINDLYSRGIDPIRSMEGRSLISMYINSRKYGDLNKLKSNDINKKAYDASVAKLGDKYDPNYEIFIHGFDPRTFRSVDENGNIHTFDNIYAQPYTNLHDMVHPTLAAIKPHLLTREEAKSKLGDSYDPRNKYVGVTEDDMRKALQSYLPGIRNSGNYKYQAYLAEQDLINEGKVPTQADIEERLRENAILSDYGVTTPLEESADEWQMAAYNRATQLMRANQDNQLPNIQPIYSFEDDLYESGLKNMIGLSSYHSYGYDKDGNPITQQQLSNENPEFYKIYALRVKESKSPVRMLTHQRGEGLKDLPSRMGEKVLTKYGRNNDVTGRGFYSIDERSLGNLITGKQLEEEIKNAAGVAVGPRYNVDTNRPRYDIPNKVRTGLSGQHCAYQVDTSGDRGIVTGIVLRGSGGNESARVETYVPILVYTNHKLDNPVRLYKRIDYSSMESSGGYDEFSKKGVSTIYNGKYKIASNASSSNVDRSMHVGSTDIKSSSVSPTF